jgi:hypothetical protein
MVNYGDQVFLQVNSLDNRWLSGGRNGGNEGVITRDHLSSDYELENAENTYKWTVRSTSGDGSRNYPDPKQGECLKYGDQVFLQANLLDNRWLSGARGGGNEGVLTRDHLSSSYELKNAEKTYKWTARSTAGTGTRTNSNNQDPGHGACIEELSLIFLQANLLDNRWLSGGRYTLADNEGVFVRNRLSSEYEQAENPYEWIVRKSSGTGSRSDAIKCDAFALIFRPSYGVQ